VTPYSGYQLYQAERIKSDAERNQADAQLGMMAAAVSQLWRQVTTPVRALRRHRAENHLATHAPPKTHLASREISPVGDGK
jgi:hypothetical protein